ncbi:glycoside hydrolase domain-containing protein [Streptomyces sp. NBC_00986]|uniref:glycoside hydrolase domain-containing protein n=1 Tax=Streptomyces sp. NBC_00986 TaxID=2903702 RepID=UPI00386B75DF|nr:DUF1906 domain-containing protein [Streptomyces sp. NBC_00986]
MADQKVLEAQQWVNATYKSVSGYQACPEDGKTGWATMYSLTMGLQSELGISPVVANFGAGTLSRLAALGNLTLGWNTKPNIVRILRHGLFCKGYWGGDYGVSSYDTDAAAGINGMKSDMGLSQDSTTQAKVFKAVLNMDAYVVLAGGTDEVRSIQQWLNSRYWTKSTFTIGPADGHFSRDVQQALMKAIQLELGIAEDQATGTFGPATQAALKTHPVTVGDSGIFVQLFSAACVFNQPVIDSKGIPWNTSFKSTFDDKLTDFVTQFQTFSALPVNHYGDFATWAQLLISTGDPDRSVNASDTAYTITPSRGSKMYADGYRYVGRYINESPGGGSKILEEGELADIFGAGLHVFPIFQGAARAYSDFDWSHGYDDGLLAHDQAVHFGFNRSAVIYFACDYDATSDEMPKIIEYFQGVQSGLSTRGKRYVMGVYGSRNVCAQVTNATDARYSFVSGMSTGFSGNLGFPLPQNWAFNQIKEYTVTNGTDSFGLDADAHRPTGDKGQDSVNSPTDPATGFAAYIDELYELAQQYNNGDPNRLVMEYVRHESYANLKWTSLIGDVDRDFVQYAEDHGFTVRKDFVDPFSGFPLDVQHLMASVNGHYLKPVLSNAIPNAGDVSGWAGDLYTFYGEWRRDSDSYSSGYTYCQDRLGKIDVASTFGYSDMVVDADAYLIAERVRNGESITAVVQDHYLGNGGKSRFTDYFDRRFNGTRGNATAIAMTSLLLEADPVVVGGRLFLIQSTAGTVFFVPPSGLPTDKLTEFCQGFAEAIASRAELES